MSRPRNWKPRISNSPVHGFTLVEILIVIVIIGVLSIVLIPRITSIKERAMDTRRVKDIDDIARGLTLYQYDHGEYPVARHPGWPSKTFGASGEIPGTVGSSGYRYRENSIQPTWLESLSPYLSSIPQDPKNSLKPNGKVEYVYVYRRFDGMAERNMDQKNACDLDLGYAVVGATKLSAGGKEYNPNSNCFTHKQVAYGKYVLDGGSMR